MKLRLISLFSSFLLGSVALSAAEPQVDSATPAATVAPASLSREQVLTELTRQLTDRFQLRGDLQLELLRSWIAPAPVVGGIEIEILECPGRLTSSLLLRVRLQNAGRSLGEQMLSLRAQVFRDVYVVRAPLERDATFDPSQLDTRRVDILRERDTVATSDCEGDFTFAMSVPAGRLLTWRDLAKRALVRKGQVIEVAAIDGTMTITTKALAMENGAAGDSIKVRNLTSKKDFTASVVAEARAQVHF